MRRFALRKLRARTCAASYARDRRPTVGARAWFSAYRVIIAGLIAMVIGSCILHLMPPSLGIPGYVAPLAVITVGFALFQAPNNTAVMTGIRAGQRGVVSGLLNLSRNLGLITGASVMGTVFAVGAASSNLTTASPQAVAAACGQSSSCRQL